MKKVIRYIVLILLFSLTCPERVCQAISITVTGSWTEYISSDDLQSGAGSDLNVDYWSAIETMDIDVALPSSAYQVDVKRTDTNWNTDIMISARRLSDGNGAGTITGGTAWQAILTTDSYYFDGTGDRNNIDVRLTIANVSLARGAGDYTTTVTYTIYDI